jgi:REP element-mobilizing transposase RayT
LAFVPEESEAASTLPSRPTDLRPPTGLHDVVYEPETIEEAEQIAEEEEIETPERPPRPEGPYTAYTCLWLLNDPRQELLGDFADELLYWIGDIAEENAWDIDYLDIQADYVMVSLRVPHKTLPDSVVGLMMDETAQRSADYYPDMVSDPYSLWADGYYVVTPPRTLTEREIARFITYQRQAQID